MRLSESVVLLAVLISAWDCRRQEAAGGAGLVDAGSPGAGTTGGSPAQAGTREADVEPEATIDKKMLPAWKLKKGEILVGGCKDACEAPKEAFRNFIRALFGVGDEGNPAVQTFLDTTMLTDNGKGLGAEWARMWLDGKLEEREASVRSFVSEYAERAGKVAGGSDVEAALDSGMEFRRISSEAVEIRFFPPPRSGAGSSDQWRFRLGLRGLEWLVQDIYD